MEAMNPFNSKEFKEKILAKEGKQEASDDYELFDDIIEEKSDLKNIIVGAPSIPKKAATNMILDASAIAKNEKEKKVKIDKMLEMGNNLIVKILNNDIYKLDYVLTWSKYYYL